MAIDWLFASKALSILRAGSSATKSFYDRAVGKSPAANFEAGDSGVEFRIQNVCNETIIIESILATPPLLGFSAGDELVDIVRAVVAQRGHSNEEALAVLSPGNNVSIGVITFDPFQEANADEGIKVRLKWRSVTRGMFSRSSVTSKIQVRDVRALKLAVERKQPRIRFV
ncbi:hypothetical protein [Bradyrhizobium erythrophlei]|uniref:Uncharacterized protein n=1 Tax=Bradyrhizobium erythrophlei TaxID=1437360 RepID=A0A1M5QNP6_9BRAD|nr:hypothetical protein [Bradyrhizobium erythrophlei]SHH15694.1 hypothetical protein SAMN05443248_3895 [Bradyrhizobium erythrophlei]